MKILKGRNCIAISHLGRIIFAHSDIVPFLTLSTEKDGKNTLSPLPECRILKEDDNEITIAFKSSENSVAVKLVAIQNTVVMTFDPAVNDAFLYLQAIEGERILGLGDVPFYDLKGRNFHIANKNSFGFSLWQKLWNDRTVKIKNITPNYIGDHYGVKIDGDVEEIDFTSQLATKITFHRLVRITFTVFEGDRKYGEVYKEATKKNILEIRPYKKNTTVAQLLNVSASGKFPRLSPKNELYDTLAPLFNEKRNRTIAEYIDSSGENLFVKPFTDDINDGFYLGDDVLVIIKRNEKEPVTELSFPVGNWVSLSDGKVLEGAQKHTLVNKNFPFIFYRQDSSFSSIFMGC